MIGHCNYHANLLDARRATLPLGVWVPNLIGIYEATVVRPEIIFVLFSSNQVLWINPLCYIAEIFGNLRFKDDDVSGQQDSLNSVSQKEYQNSTSAGTVCISASILLYISIDNCVLTDVDIVTPCNINKF